jgi:TPR repeat protein
VAEAQNLLGVLYHQGRGVAQDYQKAAEWYHQAASQGLQWAQINIGGLWFNGDGVGQDHVMAAYWVARGEIGDDREASDQASHWVLRSKKVAEGLQSRPIDYLNMVPGERVKLSHDDITAGLIGVAIASVVWSGVQYASGVEPAPPLTENQKRYHKCLEWLNHRRLFGGGSVNPYASGTYC